MTQASWLAPVQITGSAITNANLSINYDADDSNMAETYSIDARCGELEKEADRWNLFCVLTVSGRWHEADNPDKVVFEVSCGLGINIGALASSIGADWTEDEIQYYMKANAVSLAYGKIRSFIEDLTAQSTVGKVTIPAIDVHSFMKAH